ncbi:MAG: SDR family oxidoreductase [Candidatus Wildermuthbacteria bacterium]|nr:SDR family oxidoreductase [Candidatus Wildermuthbacteria bacterium]
MKYLVTGGAGFIGSHIVQKILESGDFVRVVDNFSTGKTENIKEFLGNEKFDLMEGDLTDFAIAKKAVEEIDIVLHQAAIPSVPRSIADPIRSTNANVMGTLHILLAARDAGVKRVVYASSSSIYGDNPALPKREDFPVRPISPYALTKYVGERYAQIFWSIYQLPTLCLRYFNVFGPKQDPQSQYAPVMPKFITALLNGEQPHIFGDGSQSRDFTYVDNVVQANLLAAKADSGFGEVFNVACGKETTLNAVVQMMSRMIGSNGMPAYEPARIGDVPHSLADISKAKQILGYSPHVDIEEGIRRTIEWFKAHA